MEIVSRHGSEVLLKNKDGELWLTKRVKRKKDCSRQFIMDKGWSVRHIPIKRIPQHGDWLFTCKMEPVQFDKWIDDEKDDFISIDGSHHSKINCSLSLISNKYAEFFIKHQLWELFDVHGQCFEKYEEAVKQICSVYKIKYEGY